MKSTAAKKLKLSVPSLADRIEALREEVSDALSALAELHRPSSVPGPWLRQNWVAKAAGNVFEAYLLAVKEVSR